MPDGQLRDLLTKIYADEVGQGGTGIDAGIVNVHAEAAALFRTVGESCSDEGVRRAFWGKAKAAESRSNGVAQVLPAASTL
jgi:hypothetical protein